MFINCSIHLSFTCVSMYICVANNRCIYILLQSWLFIILLILFYSFKDFRYVCLLPKVVIRACNGQFYVNYFDIKATAYDIILFVDIFLVCVVTERMVLFSYFINFPIGVFSQCTGGICCLQDFYLFFYIQEEEFRTSWLSFSILCMLVLRE